MRLYFARHGESYANRLRIISNRGLRHGLTLTGRSQAHELAIRLEDQAINRIFTSPVLRAIETCVILADHLKIDYEVVEALREYDCGILEGRSDGETWRQWQELYDAWKANQRLDECFEDGETFYAIQARFVTFIDGLVKQFGETDARIVCVSHGGLYRMMLPQVIRNVDQDVLDRVGLGFASCLVAEYAFECESIIDVCSSRNFSAQLE